MHTPGSLHAYVFSRRHVGFVAVACAVLLVAACGRAPDRKPQPARPAEVTQQEFGNLEVHFNAVRTDQLLPDMARAYGIERGTDRVLLIVAMLEKAPGGASQPVDGTVTVAARNLNGQLKSLTMRRVQEGATVNFIGETSISGDEILVFDITVEPATGGGPRTVQFKREFFGD